MVTGTRARKKYGFGRIIAVGFQDIDPDCLEVAIECIVEAMPDGDDKTQIATDLTYWRENRQEIMDDHHVTPAEPEAE
ncbi:MAG: hypothetical protein A2312_00905 [Candidatus Staskawiczbacteria bacterium RIFOXYB2_FULL_32_9]|nr:MAG: hypothetical protein A2312_00905 [Candidatus Staskawiczbacteria bacterium RIFOXYB2_FULL_32_9]OGZ85510.1 MAG: hypothetical protein A2463_02435 [Candidatus Staskawiczbacteria bacterium RIFOXYC2_FULL_32_10]